MGDQKYTRANVAERNGRKDIPVWVIIKDVVYDITPYLNEHPGGEDVLREQAGKDATKEFDSVGHSSDAKSLLKKYRIGELVEPKKPVTAKSSARGTLVAQQKLPSPTRPPPLPPGPPSDPPATASCCSPATKADPPVEASTSSSAARTTSTSTLSGTTSESVTESGSTLAPVTPGVNVPMANISLIPSGSSVVSSANTSSGTTSSVKETPSGSTLTAPVSTATTPNVAIAATSITSTTGATASDSSSAPNAQVSGMSVFLPTTETTVPTTSAFNRPTANAPKNTSTEVPRNVADTPNALPEPDRPATKPTIKPLEPNNSSTAQPKAAAVNVTPDSNKSKLANGTPLANCQKSGLLGSPGKASTETNQCALNDKSVSSSQSLNKSQEISSSKPSTSSKSSVASEAATIVSSVSQPVSKVSSSSGKPAAPKSQLSWNTAKKPTNCTTNAFTSSSSSYNSKPATYDPYKKDKGSFGGFSSFKKK